LISIPRKITFSDPSNLPELIEGCLVGNASCQKMLYKAYFSYAKAICLRYGSSKEEAEEIMNDGFIKVFSKIQKFEKGSTFRPWLKTIMINTALDYYRRGVKHQGDMSLEDAPELDFNAEIIDDMSADEILALVQRLSPAYRSAFSLFVVEGYSHKEIAEMMNTTEGTSKSNLAKARLKMQEMILKERPELAYKISRDLG
jgi:RNA polymerase sigma-70 factor, ECF subfamily